MKNLIAANWKMNPLSQKEAVDIFDKIKAGVSDAQSDVVICPPAVYLSSLKGLALGAENVYFEDKGAFTGEISVMMLKDLGVEYVIVGHSERRKYFEETNAMVNKKIKKSLDAGLKVIFCIGETAEERDQNRKEQVLATQIKEGLDGINNYENINVAYEPVWAIGTGNNCSVKETEESIAFIRETIGNNDVRILYGGSVKSDNSGSYIKEAKANGLLVGGASLIPEEFIRIVKSAE